MGCRAGYILSILASFDPHSYRNVDPEDTDPDPTTLYVGNHTNNITVKDMFRIFPKGRRKDEGFAIKKNKIYPKH